MHSAITPAPCNHMSGGRCDAKAAWLARQLSPSDDAAAPPCCSLLTNVCLHNDELVLRNSERNTPLDLSARDVELVQRWSNTQLHGNHKRLG